MDINLQLKHLKQSKLLRGFTITTLWGGLSKLLVLLVAFYCSNFLTKEGFGEYSFIKNTLNMVLVICAANFASLATKFASESVLSVISLKRLYILLLFVIGISVFCGISILVIPIKAIQSFIGGESIAFFVKLLGLLAPILIVQPLIVAILRGYKEFNKAGVYEVLMSLLYLILVIIGIYFWDYKGAICAIISYYVLSSIVGAILLYLYNKKSNYLIPVNEFKSECHVLHEMIVPVFLISFIEVPLTWLAQAEMGRRASYEMVGSLSIIFSIRYIIQTPPTYFYQVFIPLAAELALSKKHNEYFRKFKQIAIAHVFIIIIFIPLLILGGRQILGLYGEVYIEQYPSFLISLAIIPLLLFSILYKTNMVVREHQRLMLWMIFISSICFFASFYLFISLNINVLNSYLFAQGLQYLIQLIFSIIAFDRDKKHLTTSLKF